MLLLTASLKEDIVLSVNGSEMARFRVFRWNGKWRCGIYAPAEVKITRVPHEETTEDETEVKHE